MSSKTEEKSYLPISIKTVGDMKKVLERFDDSAIIDACYTFKRKDLQDIEMEELNPEDEIYQEFSLSLESEREKDIASFNLELVDQNMTIYH